MFLYYKLYINCSWPLLLLLFSAIFFNVLSSYAHMERNFSGENTYKKKKKKLFSFLYAVKVNAIKNP